MIDFEALPALLAVPRAAQMLGLSRASAYRWANSGELPTRRIGGRVYFVTARLQEFLDGARSGERAAA